MKAVILSGGQGTRLRPITYSVPKQLVPVAGRSVLARVIDDIRRAGVREIAVVTSPEAEASVVALLDRIGVDDPRPKVLIQSAPDGLAAAFEVALPYVAGDESILYLGDCLVTGGIGHVIEEHRARAADASILVRSVDDPTRYGIVELGEDGLVRRLVEKPQEPQSDLAIVGVYVFRRDIDEIIAEVTPSWRGEREITDALQIIVDRGGTVATSNLNGWWVDTGTIDDVFHAHELLLSDLESDVSGEIIDSTVEGAVVVEAGARAVHSVLRGPVIVERGAVLEGSEIGPNTTLGRGVTVRDAKVDRSIVMDDATIGSVTVGYSMIGPRAVIRGSGRQDQLSVVVGADASIGSGKSNQD